MRSLLLVLLAAGAVRAQSAPAHTLPPTREELDAISVRGLALAACDRAAWEATDALLLLHPDYHDLQHYVVEFGRPGWPVYFGKLSAAHDTFYVAYVAEKKGSDTVYTVSHLSSPDPDTGNRLHAVRALVTALAAFGPTTRPYNHAVIPIGAGEWWVYVYPAQTTTSFWPLGGDERFRINADGDQILERHRMHLDILEVPLGDVKGPPGYIRDGYIHTDVVDNRPEDTDVFGVLSRQPRSFERVLARRWLYRINANGRITSPVSVDSL